MNNTISRIARDILHLDTLQTRKSDSLDFHDLAVWSIKAALEAAYRAGWNAAKSSHSSEINEQNPLDKHAD